MKLIQAPLGLVKTHSKVQNHIELFPTHLKLIKLSLEEPDPFESHLDTFKRIQTFMINSAAFSIRQYVSNTFAPHSNTFKRHSKIQTLRAHKPHFTARKILQNQLADCLELVPILPILGTIHSYYAETRQTYEKTASSVKSGSNIELHVGPGASIQCVYSRFCAQQYYHRDVVNQHC